MNFLNPIMNKKIPRYKRLERLVEKMECKIADGWFEGEELWGKGNYLLDSLLLNDNFFIILKSFCIFFCQQY